MFTVNGRSCKDCTKCCEGWITSSIGDEIVTIDKPCIFVEQGIGCRRYETRPGDPCVGFVCGWLGNTAFPDYFQPNVSGVIIFDQVFENIQLLRMSRAPKLPTKEMVDFFLQYTEDNNLNARWVDEDGEHWRGTSEFEELMERTNGNGR